MAQATLTIADSNLPDETYSLNLRVDDSKVSDGKFTAAHLVGAFLMQKMASGELTRETNRYCAEVGIDISEARPEDSAVVTFTFLDQDLAMGTYGCTIDVQRGDDAMYFTSALAVAHYLSTRIKTAEFIDELWSFAEGVVAKNDGAAIVNANHRHDLTANHSEAA